MGFLFGGLLAWLGGNPVGLFVGGRAVPASPVVRMASACARYRREQLGPQGPPAELLATWQPRVQRLALAHGVALSLSAVACASWACASYDFMLLVYAALMGIGSRPRRPDVYAHWQHLPRASSSA